MVGYPVQSFVYVLLSFGIAQDVQKWVDTVPKHPAYRPITPEYRWTGNLNLEDNPNIERALARILSLIKRSIYAHSSWDTLNQNRFTAYREELWRRLRIGVPAGEYWQYHAFLDLDVKRMSRAIALHNYLHILTNEPGFSAIPYIGHRSQRLLARVKLENLADMVYMSYVRIAVPRWAREVLETRDSATVKRELVLLVRMREADMERTAMSEFVKDPEYWNKQIGFR